MVSLGVVVPCRNDAALLERCLDSFANQKRPADEVIVVDNLMDIEGCNADYVAQQEAMQVLNDLALTTGSTVIVLHHATDKSFEASADPYAPPARKEIKNGMSEKPQNIVTVAVNPHSEEVRVVPVKQRMAKSDPTGKRWTPLRAIVNQSRYERGSMYTPSDLSFVGRPS